VKNGVGSSAETTSTKAATEDKVDMRRGPTPNSPSGSTTATRPAAKSAAPASARPANAAAAVKGSLMDRAGVKSEPAERAEKRAIPPFVMWLMTIVAMLIVSLIALAVFYYLIANYTKMGDFLHLKLPGLPPPKAQQTALLDPLPIARSGIRENSDEQRAPPLNSHEFSYGVHRPELSSFVLRQSFGIRHSTFDIQAQRDSILDLA
jgi:hypothetical protein